MLTGQFQFLLTNIIRTKWHQLTFLAFHWGHREPEPHPPQSLSIHSLAWEPESYSMSIHHSVIVQHYTFNIHPLWWTILKWKHTTLQVAGRLCASVRCRDRTRRKPPLLGSTWRAPCRSLSWRMPWAAVPDLYGASPVKCLCCVSEWQRKKWRG